MGEMMHFPDTVEEFMELFKVIDSDHVYSNGIEFVPIFRMQQWFEHLKAQPKTEGDKIRSMSDEELAELWWERVDCEECPVHKCPVHRYCRITGLDCKKLALDWLKEGCE